MDNKNNFKILSCNVNGISTQDKRIKVIKTLREHKADAIFCLLYQLKSKVFVHVSHVVFVFS